VRHWWGNQARHVACEQDLAKKQPPIYTVEDFNNLGVTEDAGTRGARSMYDQVVGVWMAQRTAAPEWLWPLYDQNLSALSDHLKTVMDKLDVTTPSS
jgi:hypothetical protein